MNLLHCDKIEITEWYDGLIQGFIYHSNLLFYAILLAWDVNANTRKYLILPLEVSQKELITVAYTDANKWIDTSTFLKALIAQQECFYSEDMPSNNIDIRLSIAQNLFAEDIKLERFAIDQATNEPSIRRWLK